jgi:hypothetical protein
MEIWAYQVRPRHVASLGGHSERIWQWMSGGKRRKSVNMLRLPNVEVMMGRGG